MQTTKNLHSNYKKSGVDYQKLDGAKLLSQVLARETLHDVDLEKFKMREDSFGESASLLESSDFFLALTLEGLGTKSLIADAMETLTGNSFYEGIGRDGVAVIANDLMTVGAKAQLIMQYLGTGNSHWLDNHTRVEALQTVFKNACLEIGAVWGGGETPTLKGVINANTIELAGCGLGIICPKTRHLSGAKLQAGDAIVGIASSGIHANGLSAARTLAKQLPQGYLTPLKNGQTLGEALLTPTRLYGPLMESLFEAGIKLHYATNITGHGWLKLMRATEQFTYEVDTLPPVPTVLKFMVETLPLSSKEAYATFNMGLGMAFFLPEAQVAPTLRLAKKLKYKAYHMGRVIAGEKQVRLLPLNVTYAGAELGVRL